MIVTIIFSSWIIFFLKSSSFSFFFFLSITWSHFHIFYYNILLWCLILYWIEDNIGKKSVRLGRKTQLYLSYATIYLCHDREKRRGPTTYLANTMGHKCVATGLVDIRQADCSLSLYTRLSALLLTFHFLRFIFFSFLLFRIRSIFKNGRLNVDH